MDTHVPSTVTDAAAINYHAGKTRVFDVRNFVIDKLQAMKMTTNPKKQNWKLKKPSATETTATAENKSSAPVTKPPRKRKKKSKVESAHPAAELPAPAAERKNEKPSTSHEKNAVEGMEFYKDDTTFDVQEIIDKRMRDGFLEYKLLWSGYPPESASWVRKTEMQCEELIDEYEQREREKRLQKRRMDVQWERLPKKGLKPDIPPEPRSEAADLLPDNVEASQSPSLLTRILRARASATGEPLLDDSFDDFELSASFSPFAHVTNDEFYRNTQPKRITEFKMNTHGDPFVVMQWVDDFKMAVTFPAAVKYYPEVFVPWLEKYARDQAAHAGCSYEELIDTADDIEKMEKLLEENKKPSKKKKKKTVATSSVGVDYYNQLDVQKLLSMDGDKVAKILPPDFIGVDVDANEVGTASQISTAMTTEITAKDVTACDAVVLDSVVPSMLDVEMSELTQNTQSLNLQPSNDSMPAIGTATAAEHSPEVPLRRPPESMTTGENIVLLIAPGFSLDSGSKTQSDSMSGDRPPRYTGFPVEQIRLTENRSTISADTFDGSRPSTENITTTGLSRSAALMSSPNPAFIEHGRLVGVTGKSETVPVKPPVTAAASLRSSEPEADVNLSVLVAETVLPIDKTPNLKHKARSRKMNGQAGNSSATEKAQSAAVPTSSTTDLAPSNAGILETVSMPSKTVELSKTVETLLRDHSPSAIPETDASRVPSGIKSVGTPKRTPKSAQDVLQKPSASLSAVTKERETCAVKPVFATKTVISAQKSLSREASVARQAKSSASSDSNKKISSAISDKTTEVDGPVLPVEPKVVHQTKPSLTGNDENSAGTHADLDKTEVPAPKIRRPRGSMSAVNVALLTVLARKNSNEKLKQSTSSGLHDVAALSVPTPNENVKQSLPVIPQDVPAVSKMPQNDGISLETAPPTTRPHLPQSVPTALQHQAISLVDTDKIPALPPVSVDKKQSKTVSDGTTSKSSGPTTTPVSELTPSLQVGSVPVADPKTHLNTPAPAASQTTISDKRRSLSIGDLKDTSALWTPPGGSVIRRTLLKDIPTPTPLAASLKLSASSATLTSKASDPIKEPPSSSPTKSFPESSVFGRALKARTGTSQNGGNSEPQSEEIGQPIPTLGGRISQFMKAAVRHLSPQGRSQPPVVSAVSATPNNVLADPKEKVSPNAPSTNAGVRETVRVLPNAPASNVSASSVQPALPLVGNDQRSRGHVTAAEDSSRSIGRQPEPSSRTAPRVVRDADSGKSGGESRERSKGNQQSRSDISEAGKKSDEASTNKQGSSTLGKHDSSSVASKSTVQQPTKNIAPSTALVKNSNTAPKKPVAVLSVADEERSEALKRVAESIISARASASILPATTSSSKSNTASKLDSAMEARKVAPKIPEKLEAALNFRKLPVTNADPVQKGSDSRREDKSKSTLQVKTLPTSAPADVHHQALLESFRPTSALPKPSSAPSVRPIAPKLPAMPIMNANPVRSAILLHAPVVKEKLRPLAATKLNSLAARVNAAVPPSTVATPGQILASGYDVSKLKPQPPPDKFKQPGSRSGNRNPVEMSTTHEKNPLVDQRPGTPSNSVAVSGNARPSYSETTTGRVAPASAAQIRPAGYSNYQPQTSHANPDQQTQARPITGHLQARTTTAPARDPAAVGRRIKSPEERYGETIIDTVRRNFAHLRPDAQENVVRQKWNHLPQAERQQFIKEYENERARFRV